MKKKTDNIWGYNKLLKPICEAFTHHKHRKFIGCTEDYINNGYKYPNRSDFYYKCKTCGWVFFNHHPRPEDIEEIKKWEDNNGQRTEE